MNLFQFLSCFCLASIFAPAIASTVLFQGFNWESNKQQGGWYNSLINLVPDLANAGITHVWLPPPSQSVAPEGYMPGRLYDLDASKVQKELSDWMNWLKSEIGFDGWRFDFVRGYAASISKIYMENTSPEFAVGEFWNDMAYGSDGKPDYNQDKHRNELSQWVQGAGGVATAFDFTTKGILQAAVLGELGRLKDSAGKPSGLIGIAPKNAVTFIDNHDTGSTQSHWPFPRDKVIQGYAYILTHPGIPSVFYDHFFDWGMKDEISKLISIRNSNGISETSGIEILAADADLYVAKIGDKVIAKIGPKDAGNLIPPGFSLATSGQDYAVWEQKA
nr:alpha-amylase-like [Ipomoea batatas]